MKLLHIVGRKNHGKTMLLVELIEEFVRRGLRVGSIKHTEHVHELDKPESDSWRQRRAGASPAAIVTGDLTGVFLPKRPTDDYLSQLAPLFEDCDLVLVEGDLDGPGPKVEVWRTSIGTPPLAAGRADIAAVVTDDAVSVPVPVWPRGDVRSLADRVLELASTPGSPFPRGA